VADDEVSIPSQSDIDKKVNKLLNTSESSDFGSSEEEEWSINDLKQDYLEDVAKGSEVMRSWQTSLTRLKKQA